MNPASTALTLAYDASLQEASGDPQPLQLAALKQAMARVEAETRAELTAEARLAMETSAREMAEARARSEHESSRAAEARETGCEACYHGG